MIDTNQTKSYDVYKWLDKASDYLMTEPDLIGNASLEHLKAGYLEQADHFLCLCCGKAFEKGIIYPDGGVLYEAERYTRRHIEQEHQSVFQHLIRLDKSVTGLTELQSQLLEHFYLGLTDQAVQQALAIGSTSTIRNHRFALKEKERQARVFLAIMELLRGASAPRTRSQSGPERTT